MSDSRVRLTMGTGSDDHWDQPPVSRFPWSPERRVTKEKNATFKQRRSQVLGQVTSSSVGPVAVAG